MMKFQDLEVQDDSLLIRHSNEDISCPGEYLKSRNNLSEIRTEEAKKAARNNLDIRWGTLEGSPLENKLLEDTLKDIDNKVESNLEELLKRLLGKSDKSSAQSDPFLFKGVILSDPSKNEGGKDGAVLFNEWVNAMHGTTADLSESFNGEVRINWSGSIVKITNFVTNYVNDSWVLVIEGGINYSETKGFYLSDKYRKFSRHYTKENGWSTAVEFVGKDITDSLQQSILDNTDAIVKKTFCIGEYRSNVFTPTCKPSELISARDSETPPYFYVKNRTTIIPLGDYTSGMWNISPAHIGNVNNNIYVLFNCDYAANVRVVLTHDLSKDTFTKADVQLTTLITGNNVQQTTGQSKFFPMSQKAVTDAIAESEARGTKNIESVRSTIDQNLSDLERIVTENKNELDEDVANLHKDVQTLETNVSHQNEDIVRLQGGVLTNTNNITALGSRIDALGSVYSAQGSKNSLTELLAVTSAKKGYVYSIESEFYLNGKYYAAGTNVVCITEFSSASENKSSNWDALGGTFNASLYLEKDKAAIANKSDITSGIDRKEDITYTERGKQYISGGALGSVLPFKLISKTTLDNGYTAWYRLAFNFPTGSSNGAQQLLLQYAVTTYKSEPSAWTTINFINDINFKDISSIKTAVTNLTKNLQDNYFNKDEVQDEIAKQLDEFGPTGGGISGLLNLKDATAVRTAQDSITKNGESKTFIITDSEGNYPSPNVPLIYLDDMVQLRDLLYKGNGNALAYLLDTKEAYYQYGGTWYSQNIAGQVKLPTFNLTTARVGDLITLIRYEFTADEFYNKYINFSEISNDNLLFKAYKVAQGYGDKTDGEFIQYLIRSGAIYSCPNNPEEDSSVTPVPLAVNEKVVLYTAQITPNTQNVYSGEFWSGNINAPGIYCYVTSGRPEGTTENFIGVVSKDGTKMLLSMKNPSNNYILRNGVWQWIGVGKNTGSTGEIFNDYTNNFAHNDHGHAEGQKTYASWNSHAEGFTTTAGSPNTGNAHSEGNTTKAIGNNSHAEGINTVAEGHNSHAEGDNTQATNWNSHAEGYRTHATGNGAHAEGNSDGIDDETQQNVASGFASHVEGNGTAASGHSCHAEGHLTHASGTASHAEGIMTVASGDESSHAEGVETIATGNGSHAEGISTLAKGIYSHAEGAGTEAHGAYSHAEGLGTFAPGIEGCHAEGRFNFNNHNFIHAVGIGTSETDRRDAHTITTKGKHYIYGIGNYNGTNTSNSKDLASVINSLGIINKGTLDNQGMVALCESDEIGIFTCVDSRNRYTIIKPYIPTGTYQFLCIIDYPDGTNDLCKFGGDNNGHGGTENFVDTTVTQDSNKPISSGAVYNAIYSVLNTEV